MRIAREVWRQTWRAGIALVGGVILLAGVAEYPDQLRPGLQQVGKGARVQLAEERAQGAQERVAGLMPERVVHAFEPIDVEQDAAERSAFTFGARDLVGDVLLAAVHRLVDLLGYLARINREPLFDTAQVRSKGPVGDLIGNRLFFG